MGTRKIVSSWAITACGLAWMTGGCGWVASPSGPDALGQTMTVPFAMDYRTMLADHDVIFDSPGTAYNQDAGYNLIDGPLLGNGDLGAVVHGDPERLLINIGKNDVWDRRETLPPRPPITQAKYEKMVLSDTDGSNLQELTEISGQMESVYSGCHPTPKPCGQIILANSKLTGASFHQRLSLHDAVLTSEFTGDDLGATISTLTAYQENLVLTRYVHHGQGPLNLDVLLYRWDDAGKKAWSQEPDAMPTKPTFGADGKYFWVEYRFPAETLFPEGFQYVMMGAVTGAAYVTSLGDHTAQATLSDAHAKTVDIYVGLATSRDASDPFAEAKRVVNAAMHQGYEKVRARHEKHWHDYWGKSFIDLSDAYIERLWYLNRYFLACASRKGKVAPGLYGPWITNDHSLWHGDYHYNYNFIQIYWGTYACNTPELAWPYYDFTHRILPMAQKEAREIYNMRGAKYPLTAYPNAAQRNGYPVIPWDRNMCLSAWAAQNFWWHYLYMLDEDFLRERAYPVMAECSRFYQDFMRKEDGKYVIWPTVSPEHYGTTERFRLNRNCTIDLALIKFLLKGTIEASEILNVDKEDRAAWTQILHHLADYPTYETEAGTVFVDVENADPIEYNVPVPVAPIVPGDDVGLDSSPELLEIARNTARQIHINGNDGFVILPMAWMRLGFKDKFDQYKEMCRNRVWRNGASTYYPGFRTCGPVMENVAITAVINEMLLHSYNGKIRLFPALPDDVSARIANLRTVGAFLVAAEIKQGRVQYAKIKSLKGRPCTFYYPWKSQRVVVTDLTDNQPVECSQKLNEFTFATRSGHQYLIEERR